MSESPTSQAVPSSNRKTILLVTNQRAVVDLFRAATAAEAGRVEDDRTEYLLPDTFTEAVDRLRQNAPDLVVIDLATTSMDGWELYSHLRADPDDAALPVLLISADHDMADRLATLRPDLDDYMTRPLRAQEIQYRVRHLMARAKPGKPVVTEPKGTGRIIAFCSNKGGVGKTFVAVNLAVALRNQTGKPVVIVDGDFFYGNVGTYMGVPPVRSIMDLISVAGELKSEAADRVLIRHASGVRVLLSPSRPDEAASISPLHVHQILEFLASTYDYVIVDCQTVIDHRLIPALEMASDIVLVATPEMGALKNMRILLDQLQEVGINLQKIRVVLNRAASNVEIEARDIEQAFNQKVDFSLSSGGRAVILSVNRGVPLVMDQAKHPVALQIRKMADFFASKPEQRPAAKPASKRR
jgi:pilus assembly protein CpaE